MAEKDTSEGRKLTVRLEYSPTESPVWALYDKQGNYVGYLDKAAVNDVLQQYYTFASYERKT